MAGGNRHLFRQQAGATGWLVKPFNPEKLLATIAKVCSPCRSILKWRILKVFFDESEEGLNAMESGLLTLGSANCASGDAINTIFRAAHSIKGGAGTFGFMEISHFTHSVETLLDEMRKDAPAIGRRDTQHGARGAGEASDRHHDR